MARLDLCGDLRDFLDDRIDEITVRACFIFAGLFGYLFEERLSVCVLCLNSPHLMPVIEDLLLGQQHSAALLAHHLQDGDQMLEVSDVVNGEIKMGVPEVPYTVL